MAKPPAPALSLSISSSHTSPLVPSHGPIGGGHDANIDLKNRIMKYQLELDAYFEHKGLTIAVFVVSSSGVLNCEHCYLVILIPRGQNVVIITGLTWNYGR